MNYRELEEKVKRMRKEEISFSYGCDDFEERKRDKDFRSAEDLADEYREMNRLLFRLNDTVENADWPDTIFKFRKRAENSIREKAGHVEKRLCGKMDRCLEEMALGAESNETEVMFLLDDRESGEEEFKRCWDYIYRYTSDLRELESIIEDPSLYVGERDRYRKAVKKGRKWINSTSEMIWLYCGSQSMLNT